MNRRADLVITWLETYGGRVCGFGVLPWTMKVETNLKGERDGREVGRQGGAELQKAKRGWSRCCQNI